MIVLTVKTMRRKPRLTRTGIDIRTLIRLPVALQVFQLTLVFRMNMSRTIRSKSPCRSSSRLASATAN